MARRDWGLAGVSLPVYTGDARSSHVASAPEAPPTPLWRSRAADPGSEAPGRTGDAGHPTAGDEPGFARSALAQSPDPTEPYTSICFECLEPADYTCDSCGGGFCGTHVVHRGPLVFCDGCAAFYPRRSV